MAWKKQGKKPGTRPPRGPKSQQRPRSPDNGDRLNSSSIILSAHVAASMAARTKIIIDTDPGVDDVLAMLLALAGSPEQLEVLLISVSYGNVDVQNCLRNVVALFHIINKEQAWRREQGRPEGFDMLKQNIKPIVAVGAEGPLTDQLMMADFFHGKDGLGEVHSTHPELSPSETWKTLFEHTKDTISASEVTKEGELKTAEDEHSSFTPSNLPAHKQILETLKEHDADTITIVAIGPMTNLALAAAEDTETFLRVKEVVVMGGAVDVPGNMTPLAEFNIHSDAFAAARLFALTSPDPSSTMPPTPAHMAMHTTDPPSPPFLTPYPEKLSKRLKLSLVPLDITMRHVLKEDSYLKAVESLKEEKSPLATWVSAFVAPVFKRSLNRTISLHDPLAVYYASTSETGWEVTEEQDIRVEASGQWTRGALIVDRRGRAKKKRGSERGDIGGWLDVDKGNQVRVVKESPGDGANEVGDEMVERIFGVELSKQ